MSFPNTILPRFQPLTHCAELVWWWWKCPSAAALPAQAAPVLCERPGQRRHIGTHQHLLRLPELCRNTAGLRNTLDIPGWCKMLPRYTAPVGSREKEFRATRSQLMSSVSIQPLRLESKIKSQAACFLLSHPSPPKHMVVCKDRNTH